MFLPIELSFETYLFITLCNKYNDKFVKWNSIFIILGRKYYIFKLRLHEDFLILFLIICLRRKLEVGFIIILEKIKTI
jgi:hypothetical protein